MGSIRAGDDNAMSIYSQNQWLKRHNAQPLQCPNCRTEFCMSGNEYGNEQAPNGAFSPMARCPSCGIISTEGLDIQGSRWWQPMRDLSRMTEEAEAEYAAKREAQGVQS